MLDNFKKFNFVNYFQRREDYGMGIGDWGLGIGDWAQSPITNPQSPIPNPQENIKSLTLWLNF